MSRTKSSKKKKNKNDLKQFNRDLIGSLIVVVGILWMISLFSFQMGIIGSLLRGTSFFLMGFGAYFFPIGLIAVGLIFILDRFDNREMEKALLIIALYLTLLIFLDSKNMDVVGFIDRIRAANFHSLDHKGGGFLGAIFGYLIYSLFGKGAYLIVASSFIISSLLLFDKNIKVLIKDIDLRGKIKKDEGDKEPKKKRVKKAKAMLDKAKSNKEASKKEVRIVDYNSSEKKNEKENPIEEEIIIRSPKTENISYTLPPLSLLKSYDNKKDDSEKKEIINNAKLIEETMKNFGIEATITQINRGPTITCYELSPSPGIKLSRIVSLADNIAMSLATSDIRIEAPIPGKSAVGIEVPNRVKDSVSLKEMLLSDEYLNIDSNLPLVLGKDVSGKPIVSSIDKMPHLLIAGATGSGKSVCINTIIMSIIYKSSPEEVRLILIDPKVVELSIYNDIPHLLIPVVTDPKKASFALNWAVDEMEKRYKLFAQNSVRDMKSYNEKQRAKNEETLPSIVIIIDELADLMMVAAQEIEDYICRLAQMARAAGIYLIIATQRPSVDVITGTIKANVPSRISFAVSSQVDSRTILDMAGAEKLLGRGDMLFYPSFYSKPLRVQGAFVSDSEVESVVNFLKTNNESDYDEEIIDVVQNSAELKTDFNDELLPEAIKMVVEEGQASISLLQRRLRIGYARAARLIDEMEARGIVGGFEGSKPRKVLITEEDLEEEFD